MEQDKTWTFVSIAEERRMKRKLIQPKAKKYQFVEFQFKVHLNDHVKSPKHRPSKKPRLTSSIPSSFSSPTMEPQLHFQANASQVHHHHVSDMVQKEVVVSSGKPTTVPTDTFLSPNELEQMSSLDQQQSPILQEQQVEAFPTVAFNDQYFYTEVTNWLQQLPFDDLNWTEFLL